MEATIAAPLLPSARLATSFTAHVFADGLGTPRGLAVSSSGDLLVVEREGDSKITALWDDNGDGVSSVTERAVLADSASDLNHGIAIHGGFLYASSDSTVYRWPYDGSERSSLGQHTIVINNINANGQGGAPLGHWTRTLKFDAAGDLFVSVGSAGNVDADPFRSRVRRFDAAAVGASSVETPIDFLAGLVWADGLRNEVGLAFDAAGVLWGVENGADNLNRADLGGDIHNDNPGEELNRLAGPAGTFYGYPYCWSEYSLPSEHSRGRGAQWAWPSFIPEYTDAWCEANAEPPRLLLPAHSAPLGLTFFGSNASAPCTDDGGDGGFPWTPGAFPCSMRGDAFVALHGSWNRDTPIGYELVHLPFDGLGGEPTGEVVELLTHAGEGAKWPTNVRPVDVVFGLGSTLFVTSDTSDEIFEIRYNASGWSCCNPGEEAQEQRFSAAAIGGAAGAVAVVVLLGWAGWRETKRSRARRGKATPAGSATTIEKA